MVEELIKTKPLVLLKYELMKGSVLLVEFLVPGWSVDIDNFHPGLILLLSTRGDF